MQLSVNSANTITKYIILRAAQNSLEGRRLESLCLGSPCGALLFVYVNLSANDPSRVQPPTSDQNSVEDEPFVAYIMKTCR